MVNMHKACFALRQFLLPAILILPTGSSFLSFPFIHFHSQPHHHAGLTCCSWSCSEIIENVSASNLTRQDSKASQQCKWYEIFYQLNFTQSLHHYSILASRYMSGLPYHIVMGMPALSPTMEAGTLASWNVKEGDSFIAGDSLAKIDTDKASMDFEAQDDGVVARLLIPDGSEDVSVNAPIMVVVESVDDVAAFANWVPPAVEIVAKPLETASPPTPPVVVASPPPVVAAAPVVTAPIADPPVVVAAPPMATPILTAAPTMGPAWGATAKVTSPIAKTLAANQKAYIEMYGTTGQRPL